MGGDSTGMRVMPVQLQCDMLIQDTILMTLKDDERSILNKIIRETVPLAMIRTIINEEFCNHPKKSLLPPVQRPS